MASKKQRDKQTSAQAKRSGGKGRKIGDTQALKMDACAEAIRLFLAGWSVTQIAQHLNRDEKSIYRYVADARCELLRQKKEHFDACLALYLDDAFDALAGHHRLLQDEEFLRTADPERIKAVGINLGILSDKCFVLLAASGCRRGSQSRQPAEQAAEHVVGE